MKSFDDKYEKVREAFKQVRQGPSTVEVSSQWQANVMREIRKLETSNSKAGALISFEKFFWRFSVAGQLSLMIALLYMFKTVCSYTFMDLGIDSQLTQLLFDDPVMMVFPDHLGMN